MPEPIFGLPLEQLRERVSAKWRLYPDDIIPAWVAEMDCTIAEPVQDAIRRMLELGDTGYPLKDRYVEAFAAFADRHWDWAVEPDRAVLSPDVMMGILVVLLQVTDPGDVVVINDPVYPPFEHFPALIGRQVRRAAMTESGRLDLAGLEEAFAGAAAGGRRAAYLLCNPHNPTGVVHTEAELSEVARLADQHGVSVISDEIHGPLVYAEARFTPYLSLPGIERGFAVHSAAKTFSLAALKAGVVVAAPGDTGAFAGMAHGPNASLSGVYAHAAAWNHGDAWLVQLLTELDANRRLVVDRLAAQLPGVAVRMPEATYLMWLDCRALGLGEDPATFFRDRAKVALNSGPSFGPAGEGHARLNIATSPEILAEIIDRIAVASTFR
ncbi:MAG: aminotransferase class I/II-fold pyridoxal phosphate-dependent enzyme [Tetrasphaera sp.]